MKGGIDFGSRNSSIAIAKGKVEVIQNEVSSRQTAYVFFLAHILLII